MKFCWLGGIGRTKTLMVAGYGNIHSTGNATLFLFRGNLILSHKARPPEPKAAITKGFRLPSLQAQAASVPGQVRSNTTNPWRTCFVLSLLNKIEQARWFEYMLLGDL